MKLVKFSLLFILLTLILSNLNAIDEKGIKAGLNFSTLTGENMNNAEFRPNLTAGFYLNKRVNSWLVLQPELLFSLKGTNYDGTEKIFADDDGDGSFDEDPFDGIDNDGDGFIDEDYPYLDFKVKGYYQLSYLEIPLLLKASTEGFLSKNLNLIFGPSFNFLLDAKYKLKQEGYSYLEGDLSELNNIDVSGVFGLEYSNGRYSVELRANYSFSKNDFISTGEAILKEMENLDEHFGPSDEDIFEYIKFTEVIGFNTSVSLILGFSF